MTPEGTNFLIALVGIVVGAVLGGGGVLMVLNRILSKAKDDRISLDYLEKVYNAIPVDVVKELIRNAVLVADKVTDGKPNDTPVG